MKARCHQYFYIVMAIYGSDNKILTILIGHPKTCLAKGDKRMKDKKQYQYKIIPNKSHTLYLNKIN